MKSKVLDSSSKRRGRKLWRGNGWETGKEGGGGLSFEGWSESEETAAPRTDLKATLGQLEETGPSTYCPF